MPVPAGGPEPERSSPVPDTPEPGTREPDHPAPDDLTPGDPELDADVDNPEPDDPEPGDPEFDADVDDPEPDDPEPDDPEPDDPEPDDPSPDTPDPEDNGPDPAPLVDLEELSRRVPLPDEAAAARTREALAAALPADAYGRLADLAAWLSGTSGASPPTAPQRVRALVVAGDHGIATAGVTVQPEDATDVALAALADGSALACRLADLVGASLGVVDTRTDADPATRLDVEDVLSRDAAERAFADGVRLADEEVDAGADLLVVGHVGRAATTPAAVLVGLLTRTEVVEVVGRGSGLDDRGWMRKAAAVRDGMRRGRPHIADRIALLGAVGGADLALLTGLLVRAAGRRTPVVLDGLPVLAAALVAQRVAYRGPRWWLAASTDPEPGIRPALARLDLTPVLDLGVRAGSAAGGLLAVPVLLAATELLPRG